MRALAAGLAGRGVRQGDRILIHADNCPEMVLAWYACAVVGAVGVTTNTRSVQAELEFFITKTGCTGAVTQPSFARMVAAAGPDLAWIAVTADDEGSPVRRRGWMRRLDTVRLARRGARGRTRPGTRNRWPRWGSSSRRGPPRSRRRSCTRTPMRCGPARVGPTNISMGHDDTYLVFLPFFHVNAQSWSFWTTLGVGGTIVLQPKFSSTRFWEVVTKHHVTHLSLIPFVYSAIAGQPIPEHSVKVGVFGLIVPELEAWLGFRVVPAYGMTETVIHATNDNPGRLVPKGSMGKPTPGYELLIVDRETGEVCTDGRPGELWVRGTRGIQLFFEYYDNPEAMAKSFTEDGWFRTGDVVRLAEGGNYVYCDRDADVLKVGGENVSAREVEDACRQVPGIADVAVVAQSHEMLSEVPGRLRHQGARGRGGRRGPGGGHHRGVRVGAGRLQGPPGRLRGGRVPPGHAGQGGEEQAPRARRRGRHRGPGRLTTLRTGTRDWGSRTGTRRPTRGAGSRTPGTHRPTSADRRGVGGSRS